MGIGTYIQQPVGLLSGGQKKRVAMARVLMEEPDLLILDEPTNHLDLETVEWLEVMVLDRFPTLLLVTHDRYFLDNVCNMMVELDKGEVFKYKGNYAYFLEKKEAREEVRNAEIDKAQNLMKRELEWIRRQPKARGTKAKYRVDAFGAIKQKAQRQKTDSSLELQMKTTRLGGKVINLKNIAKRYDEMVLVREFSHSFQKGERVGIIGKNGVGKTTFLQILTGALPPDKGDWDIGETTVIGYYRQDDSSLPENKRVLEVVKDMAEVIELANGDKITCSQFLQMFLFPPYMHHAFVSTLSGGEKRRLQLLCVLIKNPNFLILDEPTNDLDIGTLNVLEEFLENYAGTLVLVSHDRYFMDKIIDHLFVFEGEGEIRDFPGNYTDYREWLKEEQEMKRAEVKKQVLEVAPEPPAKMEAKRKRSFKQQKHYEHLETEIASLEQEKKELTALLNSGETDYSQLLAATTRLKSVEDLLDEKSLEWLELSEWEAFG
jgi:ATP-binding cassette subfamily F protein uup